MKESQLASPLLSPTPSLDDKRTSRSPTVISSSKANDANFEILFKRSHPWQSLYVADNVDKSIEEVKYI